MVSALYCCKIAHRTVPCATLCYTLCYSKAEKEAFIDAALQIGGATLGGGISGSFMGGGYSKIQSIDAITARLNGQDLTKTQKSILRSATDSPTVQSVISDVQKSKSSRIDMDSQDPAVGNVGHPARNGTQAVPYGKFQFIELSVTGPRSALGRPPGDVAHWPSWCSAQLIQTDRLPVSIAPLLCCRPNSIYRAAAFFRVSISATATAVMPPASLPTITAGSIPGAKPAVKPR